MTHPTLWDAAGIRHCPVPLTVDDQRRLFADWLDANPMLVEQMERWALMLDMRNGYVSVDHIFNKARFESDIAAVGVPFEDDSGKPHEYKLNNNDRSLFGRWLLDRHPQLSVKLRRSMFDGEGE